ncbi:hypothetical protein BH09ACT6_BH09ACT6_05260 [soil metagenome]
MKFKTVIATGIAAAMATALVACSTGGSGSDSASSTGGPLPAGEYTIGLEAMLTGTYASAGKELSEGEHFAVDEINQTGYLGPGATLKVSEIDAAADPARSIAALTTFSQQGVSGVVCCSISPVAGALAPVAKNLKIPIVIHTAVLPNIANPPYVYRLLPSLSASGYNIAIQRMLAAHPAKTAVVAVTKDSDGTVADAKAMEAQLSKSGVSDVTEVTSLAADTDMSGMATQIIAKKPDLVLMSMIYPSPLLLIKELRNRGYSGPVVSTKSFATADSWSLSGGAVAGALFPIEYWTGSTQPAAVAFTTAFQKAKGKAPTVYDAQAYAATYLLAEGIKNSGTGRAVDVGAALAKITSVDSVFGTLALTNGQGVFSSDPEMLTWSDGKLVPWTP